MTSRGGGWCLVGTIVGLLVAGCQVQPTLPPTPTPTQTASPTPASPSPSATIVPDPDRGAQLYRSVGCARCHGLDAEGGVNPTLAGLQLSFTAFLRQVRTPRGDMEPFPPERLSQEELAHIYGWLRSLPRPSPTPGE